MNSPLLKNLALLGLVSLHLGILLFGGYFLSPEFLLYPYLTQHGFLPYTQLIDQHLPVVLFGPLSLPYFLVASPQSLLVLFLGLTATTDLALFLTFKKNQADWPLLLLSLFILLSLYFSGNTFWLNSFINLFLALGLLLLASQKTLAQFSAGFLAALILLLKPTLLPALLILAFVLKTRINRAFLTGFLLAPLISLLYLLQNNLLAPFLDIFFNFNAKVYTTLAAKSPTLRQSGEAALLLFGSLFVFVKYKRTKLWLALPLFLLLAYPRFEPFHLQPFLLVLVFLLSLLLFKKLHLWALGLLCLLLLGLVFLKASRFRYGNFYFPPSLYQIAQRLESLPQDSLYILGGSDLLYPLSGKLPPGKTYLPSLPWYLNQPAYQQKIISSLQASPQTPVLLRLDSEVDDQSIIDSSGTIWEYIEQNYEKIDQINGYQLYQAKALD